MKALSPAVWVLSAIWCSGSWLARRAVGAGILHAEELGVRVVSVGNLQAGGSGKTPVVARIAKEACERGLKTCILSRGYRGRWESEGGLIEPGTEPANPALSGDEPALLHRLVPQAWIAVGADRVQRFREAQTRVDTRFDLVILDDGFQHWKIAKDVEILVMTSVRWGERMFRDLPIMAQCSDLVVWTKGEKAPATYGKPCVHVRYHVSGNSGGKPLWIICAVGDPRSVVETAKSGGFEVARQTVLGDHATFSLHEIHRWLAEAKDSGQDIAVTGKDWVKWNALGVSQSEVVVLEPELEFVSGRGDWEKILWG